jgi:TctA family transporter
MKNPVYVNLIIYCCLLTIFTTFLFYAMTGISVYTIASLISGVIVAFLNLLEEEVIHKKIHDEQ